MNIPDVFWLPLQRLRGGYQLVWIEDTADVTGLDAELVTDDYQSAINTAMGNYLKNSDWYITRQSETGVATPQDVLDKRAICRANII